MSSDQQEIDRRHHQLAADLATLRDLALARAPEVHLVFVTNRQRDEQKLTGRNGHGLVFATLDGDPVHPGSFSESFRRSVKRAGLRLIRLHDLRHTHATLGLAAGIPAKVMSDRLGHATVAFTQDIYMHAIPALEESAAQQVADLIFDDDNSSHTDKRGVKG